MRAQLLLPLHRPPDANQAGAEHELTLALLQRLEALEAIPPEGWDALTPEPRGPAEEALAALRENLARRPAGRAAAGVGAAFGAGGARGLSGGAAALTLTLFLTLTPS